MGYNNCTLAKITKDWNLKFLAKPLPLFWGSLPLRCVLIFFKDVVILYVHGSVLWRAEMWKWRSTFILFIITPHFLDTNISHANGKYGECWIICAVLSKAFMAMLYGKEWLIRSLLITFKCFTVGCSSSYYTTCLFHISFTSVGVYNKHNNAEKFRLTFYHLRSR